VSTALIREGWFARYHGAPASLVTDDGGEHWVTRGANFVVVVSRVPAGAVLDRADQVDEHLVIVPPGVAARVEAGGEDVKVTGDTLVIVPPGPSRVTVAAPGFVYRIFTSRAHDLAAVADNAAVYADGAPDVAPLVDWPEPVGGYRVRAYRLPDHIRPGAFGRLFRTRSLMVNLFPPAPERRDPRRLSPHSHDDFEQGSLAVQGTYVHHLRYPWGPDMTSWRDDEHGTVGSPSLLIIPPRVVHTTQSVGDGPKELVDIFAPPRADFSLMPGAVCNADEYPLPADLLKVDGGAA